MLSFLNVHWFKTTDDYFGFSTISEEFSFKSDYRVASKNTNVFITKRMNLIDYFDSNILLLSVRLFKDIDFVANISEELLAKTFETLFSVINSIESHFQLSFVCLNLQIMLE